MRVLFIFLPFFGSLVYGVGTFEAFLTQHCVSCHGPKKEKGDLRIDTLSRDFKAGIDSHLWVEVVERINAGEMPPEDEPQPTQEQITKFIAELDLRIKKGKAARMSVRPPVAHYRLSRKEYQNTVYDLLGVRYDPAKPGELNEDTLWHGYERIGAQLSLSASHMNRYYRAADTVLDRAFPATPVETYKVRKTAIDLRYTRYYGGGRQGMVQEALERFGIKRPLRYLMLPNLPQANEELGRAFAPDWFGRDVTAQSGLYRMRLQASGARPPGGRFPTLRIGKKTSSNTLEDTIQFDITAPEDAPEIYEVEVFLEEPTYFSFDVIAPMAYDIQGGKKFKSHVTYKPNYLFTHSSETILLDQSAPQMFDDQGNAIFPVVLLDWIEWEGPLETEAERSTRRGLLPTDDATPDMVAGYLQGFAERAWRRSVGQEELQDYLGVYRAQLDAGVPVVDAFRSAMLGVLTSRHFLYLVEGDADARRDHLTDWELATRLSYFLRSSMPDDALVAAARDGNLKGDGLKQEVTRLLSDDGINRFIEDFSRQWLQLHKVGMFAPDLRLYRRYDTWLETSLRREPVEFFREIFMNNQSLDQFIDSDWTMVNARISDFYGLTEPKGAGFQRVSLVPEDKRGGLLTMGAVLGLSSDGTRHRPVHRGVWLSEVIYNRTPPPPPANVDPIEPVPPEGDKITVRQRLQAHATDANCASCHAGIDPLGFAWENYDAVGQWREQEIIRTGIGDNPTVDPSGKMLDGREFQNAAGFKQILMEDRDKFARAFIEHLCTYALRRVLTVDDDEDLAAIEAEAKKGDYRVKNIVRAVALSDLIRKR